MFLCAECQALTPSVFASTRDCTPSHSRYRQAPLLRLNATGCTTLGPPYRYPAPGPQTAAHQLHAQRSLPGADRAPALCHLGRAVLAQPIRAQATAILRAVAIAPIAAAALVLAVVTLPLLVSQWRRQRVHHPQPGPPAPVRHKLPARHK